MKLTVIISTYNSEEWLRKVLIGYSVQTEDEEEGGLGLLLLQRSDELPIATPERKLKFKPKAPEPDEAIFEDTEGKIVEHVTVSSTTVKEGIDDCENKPELEFTVFWTVLNRLP